jgi:hypothetical protein
MAIEPIVYLRGRWLPASQAHLSIYDFGTVLGVTINHDALLHGPVTKINGVPIGHDAVGGPIYHRLLKAWSEEVGLDIRAQILGPRASNVSASA